jgi:hypothetical protein
MRKVRLNKRSFQLLHIEGFVEPFLVGKVSSGWDAFTKEIVRFLASSRYYMEDRDGLFFVETTPDGKLIGINSFSGGFMDKMRAKARERGNAK